MMVPLNGDNDRDDNDNEDELGESCVSKGIQGVIITCICSKGRGNRT